MSTDKGKDEPVASASAGPQAARPANEAQADEQGKASASNSAPAEAARRAEEVVKKAKVDWKSMPSRAFLEASVVPLLMQGMKALAEERPEDPVEYLAAYLVKHNPKGGS
jgi:protein dpy-30